MGEAIKNLPTEDALELFKVHEHFAKCMLDAYAVVDSHGKVLKSNPLFAQLVGQRSRQILKADSISHLLQLSLAGRPLNFEELIHYPSPTRIDEVAGTVSGREDLNLIIGVYPFYSGDENVGAFMLFRDVTAETNLQGKYKDKATQSITDPLTELYNRAYFSEYIVSQVAHIEGLPKESNQRLMSVVMLDIDHFKKTNDVYGHPAGDYVIQLVAQTMKQSFRKTDVVCRYGGEEFLAILPATEMQGACVAADKFRETVANMKFEFEGQVIPVTISIGVAQLQVGAEKGNDVIARADVALYHSKESGRNTVSFHDAENPQVFHMPEEFK